MIKLCIFDSNTVFGRWFETLLREARSEVIELTPVSVSKMLVEEKLINKPLGLTEVFIANNEVDKTIIEKSVAKAYAPLHDLLNESLELLRK